MNKAILMTLIISAIAIVMMMPTTFAAVQNNDNSVTVTEFSSAAVITTSSTTSTTGNLLQTILNPTPVGSDRFGQSVSISGDNVLIGDPFDRFGFGIAGAAYLFDAATGNLLHAFLASTPTHGGDFGRSVSISGDNVLIGAALDDTASPDAGAAYLFDAATGNLLHTFLNPTPPSFDRFGSSVSISGNNVLVGAYRDNNGGAAYLFDATTGNLLHTFLKPTTSGNGFGKSVSISGDHVLIGTTGDNTGASNAGAAYLFDATTGNLLHTFLNPTAVRDGFGESVSVSGDNILIGASFADTAPPDAGAAYLFDAVTGNLLHTFLNPNAVFYDFAGHFGRSVSVSGDNILIGDPDGITASEHAGTAYLFSTLGLPDITPPAISQVSNITKQTTSPEGAIVEYPIPKVIDDIDPVSTISCDLPSGNTFPIGTTIVTCTAQDSSGNASEMIFDVIIEQPTTISQGIEQSAITPPSGRGGGSSGDTTSPTLAFDNNNSFLIDNNKISFDDNLVAKKVETGKPIQFSIKLADNQGADNIRHVSLYLNHHGENIKNDLSETAIIYDKYSDLEILDPHNLIKHANINITQENNHSIFTFEVVFSDEIETSDILFKVWDMKRNPLNLHVSDALEVILAEPTPEEPIMFEPIIDSESSVSEDTVDPEPKFSMDLFNKWAGYSAYTISDKEFLEHIKIDGEKIPSWVKKHHSKWIKDGLISHDDLIIMLDNLKTRGII